MKPPSRAALACAVLALASIAASPTLTPADIPSYCSKAATFKAKGEFDTCVAQIKALPGSATYAGKKAECETRRSSYANRYIGDCSKQLTRSLSAASLWPIR